MHSLTRRRGLTVVELTIALLLVGVLLAGVGQLAALVASHRRESERRTVALQEAANHLERLSLAPWGELTNEAARDRPLSGEAQRLLPEGELAVQIHDMELGEGADALRGKRMVVEVSWRNAAGERVEPVRLCAWRFLEEAAP